MVSQTPGEYKMFLLTISMRLKPDSTKFFSISQPIPPAPTTSTLLLRILSCRSAEKTPLTKAILPLKLNSLLRLESCCLFP